MWERESTRLSLDATGNMKRARAGTNGNAEEVKRNVDGNDGDFCPAVLVREAVERLENCARSCGDHAWRRGARISDGAYINRV